MRAASGSGGGAAAGCAAGLAFPTSVMLGACAPAGEEDRQFRLLGRRHRGKRRARVRNGVRRHVFRRRERGGFCLGQSIDAALQQVEQFRKLQGLGCGAGGVDLRTGEPYGDQQHAQVVAQPLDAARIGTQPRFEPRDRAEQRLRVGIAAAPGIFGKERAAARAFRQRGAERPIVVLAGRGPRRVRTCRFVRHVRFASAFLRGAVYQSAGLIRAAKTSPCAFLPRCRPVSRPVWPRFMPACSSWPASNCRSFRSG